MLIVLSPVTSRAETNPLHIKGHEKLFDNVGNGLVAGQMTLGFIDAYKTHEIKCWALRNGIGFGINELLKNIVHRTRPDMSDRKSFPSMHTMFGTVNVTKGWTYSITASIGLSRANANKHYISDILSGFGLGLGVNQLCGDN